jgi:flagellar biosynthesis chaperone FliJ
MKTLTQLWQEYRKACYPQPIPQTQETETHQAFFSGCQVTLERLVELSALPEDQAESELQKVMDECEGVIRSRVHTLKNRN